MASRDLGKLRIMVDANVLFAGIVWPRFPYEVLQHAVRGDCQLVLSPKIIEEAQTALYRIAPAAASRFDDVLQASGYEAAQTPTDEELASHPKLVRDSKDIHVALAAITAEVDYLITQDKDFTDRDESTAELHRQINIILPGTFLREHMGWTSAALEAIRHRTWQDLET